MSEPALDKRVGRGWTKEQSIVPELYVWAYAWAAPMQHLEVAGYSLQQVLDAISVFCLGYHQHRAAEREVPHFVEVVTVFIGAGDLLEN
jgi:hypothetical protein